jgi:uncharacterized protein (TIGR02246 family)
MTRTFVHREVGRAMALAGALILAACSADAPQPVEPPDTRAVDEAAIRDAIEEWSAAAEAKDAETFASFYADDGVLLLEAAPDVRGIAALREGIAGMMQDPDFALSFAPDDVVVARSGDLAYETGTYTLTMSGPEGEPVTQKGHYVDVWKKNAQGEWKVAVDAPVSDPSEE